MDCSLLGSSVRGIFQARILKWVAISSSTGSSWPRDWIHISCISWTGRQILYHWVTHLGSLKAKVNHIKQRVKQTKEDAEIISHIYTPQPSPLHWPSVILMVRPSHSKEMVRVLSGESEQPKRKKQETVAWILRLHLFIISCPFHVYNMTFQLLDMGAHMSMHHYHPLGTKENSMGTPQKLAIELHMTKLFQFWVFI